jgi:hypothetical protein
MTTRRTIWIVALLFVLSVPTVTSAVDQRQSTVGMPARIDQIVLPGPELEVKPLRDDRTPIVLRIAGAFVHGTSFRYDLVYYGLEPGRYDLQDYLRRKDGSPLTEVPSIFVEIKAVLPPGQVEPNELEALTAPSLGGYWTKMIIAGVLWGVGLAAILYWMVAEKLRQAASQLSSQRQLSLADRLRPIVQEAMLGRATHSRLAELERMLLAFWRRRLNLEELDAAAAIVALREHEEAGELLRQLEIWLHRPSTAKEIDVAALLRPYQDLPADDMDPKDGAPLSETT